MSSKRPACDADVIVVGGGIIGCACAYYLARRALSLILLERDSIAAGASGACDGHLAIQTKAPGLSSELAAASTELYRELPADFQTEAEFRTCGSLLIAETAEEVEALEILAASRCDAGLPVDLITGDDARRLEPALAPHIIAAAHCAADAQANPWRITLWFAQSAADCGARIISGTTVQSLTPDNDCVRLDTSEGSFAGGHVVIAAGAWVSQIASDILPDCIKPRRGEVLVTERLPRMLNGLVLSTSYLAKKYGDANAAPATLAAEQTASGNVMIGGTRDFAGFDVSVTATDTQALVRMAIRALPALADTHIIRSFAGLRPYVPDGLPLIGPVPGCPCVVMAAGHEGDGITLAPITGQMVAQYICEGVRPDPSLCADRPGL